MVKEYFQIDVAQFHRVGNMIKNKNISYSTFGNWPSFRTFWQIYLFIAAIFRVSRWKLFILRTAEDKILYLEKQIGKCW